jgi:hypothetical protein
MSDDELDREAIVARRAKLVAAALASVALGGCGDAPPPCLSPMVEESTEGAEADEVEGDEGEGTEMPPPPPPQVCLQPVIPPDLDDGEPNEGA